MHIWICKLQPRGFGKMHGTNHHDQLCWFCQTHGVNMQIIVNQFNNYKNIDMKRTLFFLTFCLVFSQGYSGELTSRLDSILDLYHTKNNFNGSVLIAEHGEVLYKNGFGYANIEHEIPNTPENKYRIASISKQFTSMLVLQMVEKGKMSLDSTIRTYIPEYPEPQGDKIAIHHLLSHTSGMPHYGGIPGFFEKYGRQHFTHREFVELFWDLDLIYKPGEEYSYSSFGYYLLGYILERVSGQDYASLLDEQILEPLGMENTGIEDHRRILNKRSYGYNHLLDYYERAQFRDLSTALATGDMYTTPLDMVRWEGALLNNTLLDAELQDLLFEPNLEGYGYGFRMGYEKLNEEDSVYYHQHTGGTNGFTSISTRLPGDEYYILVFCNTRPGEIRSINHNIINLLYEYEVDFSPSVPIAAARILERESLQESLNFIKEKASNENEDDGVEINDIYRIGSDLIHLDRVDEAIEFYKLGVDLFPESARAHVMLGDAYHSAEKKQKAIQCYAQALLLEPEDDRALERLKDIE